MVHDQTGVMPASQSDRAVLRDLASRQAERAASPVSQERKRSWTALKDLQPARPMILVEVWPIDRFISPDELVCTTPELRSIEYGLRMNIRHFDLINDDYVIPATWRLDWITRSGSYGEGLDSERKTSQQTPSLGYVYTHPLQRPGQAGQLRPRLHEVDRTLTLSRKALLEDILGDILPVETCGGLYHIGLTGELFKLIGHENLMYWSCDDPALIRHIMDYLADDRQAWLDMLAREHILTSNVNSHFVGSGSPGFSSSLSDAGRERPVDFSQVWAWTEAQETEGISPGMFTDLFLPAMARLARQAGLVYYGCCERVDDRISDILKAIPNIRAVSASPWTLVEPLAGQLGSRVVLSKKPTASFISGSEEQTCAIDAEIRELAVAARRHHCPVELIFRDLYTVHGDLDKLRRWTQRARLILEG